MLNSVKEIKELSDVKEVNELLDQGWKLLLCVCGKYVLGRVEFKERK